MADARSLLRGQRASRRVTHPYARYTDTGKLSCSLCDQHIKSEAVWTSHTKTPDHAKKALRAAEAAGKAQQGKKRKAGSDDEDTRKRIRGTDDGEEEEEGVVAESRSARVPRVQRVSDGLAGASEEAPPAAATQDDAHTSPPEPPAPAAATGSADIENDPEWLALRQMLDAAAPPQPAPARADVYANATISAAPMTAAEVAAKEGGGEKEEGVQSRQRGQREAELEADKEEAERALQDEFEEMGELEERVRRLREKREALRKGSVVELRKDVGGILGAVVAAAAEVGQGSTGVETVVEDEDEDDDDGEDEDADLDVWKFGAD